jgi:adenosylcobinamide-GDP ribazoletransferase
MLSDLLHGFALLTRLPVSRFIRSAPNLGRIVWVFPFVGLFVGAAGGLAYWGGSRLGMPIVLAAIWSFGLTLILTGAFHEDGLADAADGFGGGRTAARKLEIMRDSRIGSYGALALGWSAVVRIAAVVSIGKPHTVLIALVVAAAIARAGMIVPLLLLKPARTDGLAASMRRVPEWSATLAFAAALVLPFLLVAPVLAIVILGSGAVTALIVTGLARWQVGGHTGDIVGATEVAVECVVLTVIATLWQVLGQIA